jgi:hypothetical protein
LADRGFIRALDVWQLGGKVLFEEEALVLVELFEYVLSDLETFDELLIIGLYPLYLVAQLLYLTQQFCHFALGGPL